MQETERLAVINKVSAVTLVTNILLAAGKIAAGIFAGSNAMLADGVHTVSDVVTTVAVLIGARFSAKPEDVEHPYGHEKIEALVAVFLSLTLFATAVYIGLEGVKAILNNYAVRPGIAAVFAALFSVVSKEMMYQYTVRAAEKINSGALRADAWHHRSDAFSSIGTLVGIAGARMGITILDPLASLVVCLLIVRVAFSILNQGIDQLIDRAADISTVHNIREVITKVEGVADVDEVKTRQHGCKLYVDAEIAVDSARTVGEGHRIAENVHRQIEGTFADVKHCMVHVNPYQKEETESRDKRTN